MNLNSGRRNWRNIILSSFLSILVVTLLVSTSCSATPTQTTWRYSEFIRAVEQRQVGSVNINADRSQATVTTRDGQTVLVNLPNDPMLVDILVEHGVAVSVAPQTDESVYSRVVDVLLVLIVNLAHLVGLLGLLLWVWMLIDCATKESSQGNTKVVWILIILFANFIGALIYFLVRRPQRRRELGE